MIATRRLAAIMAVDVVGYSRLMGDGLRQEGELRAVRLAERKRGCRNQNGLVAALGIAEALELTRFANFQHVEPAGVVLLQRGFELFDGRIERFVGEPEGSKMHADGLFGLQIEMSQDGVFRVHVLVLHEPTRLIGANGQQSEIHDAVARVNLLEVPSISGVACEEDLVPAGLDDEAGPKGAISIGKGSHRPVLGGRGDDLGPFADFNLIPPIALCYAGQSLALQDGTIAQRRDDHGLIGLRDIAERVDIHVIVMIVAHQKQIDLGQVLHRQAGFTNALRAYAPKGADTRGKYRIGENIEPVDLDEKRRVIDEGQVQIADGGPRHDLRRGRIFHLGRPARALTEKPPFHEVEDGFVDGARRIEKQLAIIMI